MSSNTSFTKENLDFYLKDLAKEYKRLGGKNMPAELILIGGASILANYGFRDMTYDMDAIISASSAIKDAINHVGDKYGLPNGWLNTDFVRTKSYSPKLIEYSIYYKTFSGILTVRTVSAEYLIAMKLKSGRRYKNDLSDIVGILSAHSNKGEPLNYEQINQAICNLYGSWDGISSEARTFILSVLKESDNPELYEKYRATEKEAKNILLEIDRQYPNMLNDESIDAIFEKVRRKKRQKNEPDR